MGLFEKIKNYVTADDEDYDEDEQIEVPVQELKKKAVKSDAKTSYLSEKTDRSNKVLNIHTTAQLQVILVKPDRFDDAASIADHLREKHTVVLNLESTNKDVSRRLVDFLSGVAYALDGQIKKVANSTFIITPYNVDIMGDLIDELSNTGVFF